MTKYIENIVLKFKTNIIDIQRDMDICNKYVLFAHASEIERKKKKFQNFTLYSVWQLNKNGQIS